jgi:phage nucleotide-binding protein
MAKPPAIQKLGATQKYINMMIVAAPGFGKTVFAGSAGRALFLTTDPEGTISAKAQGSSADEWEIKHWDDLNAAYIWLKQGGCDEYDWILIDNATQAQSLGLQATMEIARKAKPGLDEFIPTQQDYQRSQIMFDRMVKQFNDLPVNVLWTAHQTTEEDAEGVSYFSAAIHGQKGALAQTILGYMNIVGFGQVVEKDNKEVRRVWFTHYGSYRGKDRYNCLGKYKDNLTIPQLESLVSAAKKRNSAPKTSTTTKTAPTRTRAAAATTRKRRAPSA